MILFLPRLGNLFKKEILTNCELCKKVFIFFLMYVIINYNYLLKIKREIYYEK